MSTPTQSDSPWTMGRLLSWTSEFLGRQGVDDPRLSAEVLLAHAARCKRIDLYAQFDRVLDAECLAQFRELVKRAAEHEPAAYLVEEKEFFSLKFRITRDVLIPRPETEELVEAVLDTCRRADWEAPRIWDLACGSGCIAIAVLRHLAAATCLASDLSPAALAVARENAQKLGVEDRIQFEVAEGLSIPREAVPQGGFHVLACNPPYIPASQIPSLDRAVRDFEPRPALTDEADGLSLYRQIAAHAAGVLSAGGFVAVEIADGAATAVRDILTTSGQFAHQATRKDRTVGKERVLVFQKAKLGV